MKNNNTFRANVGAIIINNKNEILSFKRAGSEGAWQLPQGGLEGGEDPTQAVYRELKEETGLGEEDLNLISGPTDWMAYELPLEFQKSKNVLGQVQKWFLFKLISGEDKINLDINNKPEFSEFKWVTIDKLIEEAIDFRKPVYKKLKVEFGKYLK